MSRIMPAEEYSYVEIQRAVGALDAAGFGVNRTCGFHVHVNVADLTMRQRQLVILRYAQIQRNIDAMVPPSRRGNSYCPAVTPAGIAALNDLIDSGQSGFVHRSPNGSSRHVISGRYSVTNIQWIDQQGDGARIEFRQAAATCNAAKVVGWVRFLQEMIEEVVRRSNGVNFWFRPGPRRPAARAYAYRCRRSGTEHACGQRR